jgi:prevent-host-death family protein
MREQTVERIPHRELRNNSAEILRRVTEGESFEITNHGEVVAILQPPGRESLRIYPATRKGGWSELRPAKGTGESTQKILDELREDRV